MGRSVADEEKIEIAKMQIQETILKMISDAEVDYEEWNKAGGYKVIPWWKWCMDHINVSLYK